MTDRAPEKSIDERKIALEERKLESDIEFRRLELETKTKESSWLTKLFTPLTTTILAGIVTVAGSVAGSLFQGRNTLQLEREKQQHELVVKMISVGNENQARANLQFLAESGLIADEKLAKKILEAKETPVLPPPTGTAAPRSTFSPESTIFDTTTNLRASASCLAAAGVKHVARYYRPTAARSLTSEEAQALSAAGISIVMIYQATGQSSDFSRQTGQNVANAVFPYARDTVRQPPGTAIFFAVDFDASDEQITNLVIPYFTALNEANRSQPESNRYRVGVYGSGQVVQRLRSAGLIEMAWLGASRGWRGTARAIDEGTWDLRQTSFDAASQCDARWGSANIFKPNLPNTAFAFSPSTASRTP